MKALWIRVDAHKVDSPEVCELADALDIDVVLALGYVVTLGGAVAEHTDDGNIAGVSDSTLERWARWKGKRGAFAPALRHALQNAEGEYDNWHEAMGQLVERRERDRKRKRGGNSAESPRSPRGNSAEGARDSAATERNGTERDGTSPLDLDQEGSNRRSGDLDQERAAPRAVARTATATASPLSPDCAAFLNAFYVASNDRRRVDVRAQLVALAAGKPVRYRSQFVRAYTSARLDARCREVMREGVADPDRAIAVLLTKLGDTSDGSAPGVQQAAEDRRAADEALANADPRVAELVGTVAGARSVR